MCTNANSKLRSLQDAHMSQLPADPNAQTLFIAEDKGERLTSH